MTKWIERLAIAVFCLLICIPFALTLLGVQSDSSENRTLAQAPTIAEAGTGFSAEFESYYNDTFPLRTQLVRLNSALSLNLLRTAPGDQVVAGRDGFLFFSETVPDYCDTRKVSDEYLAELSAQLKAVQDAFAGQGTAFVVAIAPNKNSIYPEHMPAAYKAGQSSVYDRLMEQLRKDGVHAADLKAALLQAKQTGLLYHKLDTHWNDRGARTAYQAIAKEAMAQNPSLQLTLYDNLILVEKPFTGDLASTMLGLEGTENSPSHTLCTFTADSDDHYAPKLNTRYTESAVFTVYRDSFGTALVPYIAQASASAFFTRALPYDFEAAAGSDVVVVEIAERNIETLLDELSVPVLAPATEEPAQPSEPDAPAAEEPEALPPGHDIPEPEFFDKNELPDNLSDVRNREDEWDDYDPFSEPPGVLVTEPEDEEIEDIHNWQLLISTGTTDACVSVQGGSFLTGTLTLRAETGGALSSFPLADGRFDASGLMPGCTYAARAELDGETVNFLLHTHPSGSAAPSVEASCLPSGLELRWEGEENTVYRIYHADFLESGWELATEIRDDRVLLPYRNAVEDNYKIVKVQNGMETAESAPVTLLTPLKDLPSSERELEQQYLPLVSREDQIIYIMARDIDGHFSIPVQCLLTSTGESETRTPTGLHEFWRKREWVTWIEGQYSHYNLDFDGRLKIHSVLFSEKNHNDPLFNMRGNLGRAVTGGCLRLTVTDAKWMYDRYEIGDFIEIIDGTRHPTLRQQLKDTLPEL